MKQKPERADRLLKRRFPSLTGRQIEEALEKRLVLSTRGKAVRKGDRSLEASDLDFQKLEAHLERLKAGNPTLEVTVIDERPDVWVIDKPAGMPSHPLSLFDETTVTHWAFHRLPSLRGEFPEIQPTVAPHRLDTGTSGLLLVAKTKAAYAFWRECFVTKRMVKRYLAWCWGSTPPDALTIETPIAHDPKDPRRMVAVLEGVSYAKPLLPALSRVEVQPAASIEGAFLARVECETGVTHQVRVHLASQGYPLVGDKLYDPEFESRRLQPQHHQLRAVALEGPGLSIHLEPGAFLDLSPKKTG